MNVEVYCQRFLGVGLRFEGKNNCFNSCLYVAVYSAKITGAKLRAWACFGKLEIIEPILLLRLFMFYLSQVSPTFLGLSSFSKKLSGFANI